MILKPGMKVKLIPWDKADAYPPDLNPEMRPHFGEIVTIRKLLRNRTGGYGKWFSIEESDGYIFTEKWIESVSIVPDHLFYIQE